MTTSTTTRREDFRNSKVVLLLRRKIDVLTVPAMVFIAILITIGATQTGTFLRPFNLGNVLIQVSPLLLVGVGQAIVIGSGGLDLSVGSTVSLVAVVTAVLFEPLGIAGALLVGLTAGLAVGLINGVAVAYGIEPFLATLATLSAVQGVAFAILKVPGGAVPSEYAALGGFVGFMPVAFPLVLSIILATAWLSRRTKAGLHILSVGGSRKVAHLAGIRVRRTLCMAYVYSALFASLAAFVLVARTRTGAPTIGAPYTLDSLAAAVLGGAVLGGGRATIGGAALGALALGLLGNVLNLTGVPAFFQTALKGALVIAAVLLPNLVAAAIQRRKRSSALQYIQRSNSPSPVEAPHDNARPSVSPPPTGDRSPATSGRQPTSDAE